MNQNLELELKFIGIKTSKKVIKILQRIESDENNGGSLNPYFGLNYADTVHQRIVECINFLENKDRKVGNCH